MVLHAARASRVPDVRAHVFRIRGDSLCYDLPVEGEGEAAGCRFVSESKLETAASVGITVEAASGKTVLLLVRQPSWAQAVKLFVNGTPETTEARDGYHRVSRIWKAGDRVEIRYDMRPRAERAGRDAQYTLWHGPWLLGIDETRNPYFFDEPMESNRLTVPLQKNGSVELQRMRSCRWARSQSLKRGSRCRTYPAATP